MIKRVGAYTLSVVLSAGQSRVVEVSAGVGAGTGNRGEVAVCGECFRRLVDNHMVDGEPRNKRMGKWIWAG